jgi:hypothetical protein
MLCKSMIVLAVATALTGGLPADALARDGGGGAHMGGGFGGAHMGGGFGGARDPTTLLAPPTPQAPSENRIPPSLSAPAQAPTINGPMSQPAFRGLTGIGQ